MDQFNIISNEQSSLDTVLCNNTYDYTYDLSANDDNVLHAPNATMPMTPFAIDGHAGYSPNDNAITEQLQVSSIQNLSVNSPNMAFNSPQIQTNDSDIFRFVIPGFQIIVIPTSSPLASLNNLDMRCQFQQDPTFLNPPFHSSSVSQSQLDQEQSYTTCINGTSITGEINNQSADCINNPQLIDNLQQQNSLELNYSFDNFNNLHG